VALDLRGIGAGDAEFAAFAVFAPAAARIPTPWFRGVLPHQGAKAPFAFLGRDGSPSRPNCAAEPPSYQRNGDCVA